MKLINKTNLNSQHLRDIILKVAEIEQLSAEDIRRVHITVKYGKHSGYREDTMSRVFSYFTGWTSIIKVVKDVLPDRKMLAKNIAWAFAKNQNVKGKLDGKHYGWGEGWQQEWAWADAMPLEFAASEEKPEPARDEKMLAEMKHCVRMIAGWERKAKLAKTKQKVWQKRFNYHERRLKEGKVTVKR